MDVSKYLCQKQTIRKFLPRKRDTKQHLINMLSGIFVNIERPFSQGNWVTIGDKTGYIIDVTWRSTRIRTFENTEVTILTSIEM